MQRRARLFKVLNVPMRALLQLPFRTPLSRRLMLVHHTGRVTGHRYRQPVSFVQDDGVLLTPGGGRWTRNLVEGRPVELRLRGRRVVAYPELVGDVDEVVGLLGVMMVANPALIRFVPFIERDGTVDRAKATTAVERGFRVVRWHVDEGKR